MVIKKKLELEKVINKGGHVTADGKNEEWATFTLRIKFDMLRQIEEAMKDSVGISRKTGWILQAIHEKLNRME